MKRDRPLNVGVEAPAMPYSRLGSGERRLLLVAAIVSLAGLAIPAVASARCPVVGQRTPSYFSLNDLGQARGVRLTAHDRQLRIPFCFPHAARQPQDGNWYVIKLYVRARFSESAAGKYLFSASTNDYSAAQIEFNVHDSIISSRSLGLFSGFETATSRSQTATASIENALQESGVDPGRATLSLKLESVGGHGIRSLTVLPRSGVGTTTASPYELHLSPSQQAVSVGVGDEASIPFTVTRRGTQPDRPVTVRLYGTSNALRPVDGVRRRFDRVGNGQDGVFHVRAESPGEHMLTLQVAHQLNQPRVLAVVQAADKSRHLRLIVVLILVGSGIVAIEAARRLRKRKHEA